MDIEDDDSEKMICPGTPVPEFDFAPSSSKPTIPVDLKLVPYESIIAAKNDQKRWNDILVAKYKNDILYLRNIDSMVMYLINRNMQAMIPITEAKNRVARQNLRWAAASKHDIVMHAQCDVLNKRRRVILNVPSFYSILEFLGGSPAAWKNERTPIKSKKRKHSDVEKEDAASKGGEEEDAIEMWKSQKVKTSLPTLLMNIKFTCKKLYSLIDWRAIAFAFQRYVHPAFRIPEPKDWNNPAYFRHYVLRQCAIPDHPQSTRGPISIAVLQPLLHRFANYCLHRLGVVILGTRTTKSIIRRIFFVKHALVSVEGVPKPTNRKHPWFGVAHIRRDMVAKDGNIHTEHTGGKTPKFVAQPSGWSALEPSVYNIAEAQEVFCGTLSKTAFEGIIGDLCDTKAKEDEDEEEEGEELDDHDGWMVFGEEKKEVEQEIEGEGEYVEDIGDNGVGKRRMTRSNSKTPDWLRDEQDSERADEISVHRKKKKKKTLSGGIFEMDRNEIDQLSEEEEFEFQPKKKKKKKSRRESDDDDE